MSGKPSCPGDPLPFRGFSFSACLFENAISNTHLLRLKRYDVIGRQEGRKLMKRVEFRRNAMNSLLRHSLVVGGALCLIVIALIVGALRPKHASGAGTAAPPEVMVAQVEQKDVPLRRMDRYVGRGCECQRSGAGHRIFAPARLPGRRLRQRGSTTF